MFVRSLHCLNWFAVCQWDTKVDVFRAGCLDIPCQ